MEWDQDLAKLVNQLPARWSGQRVPLIQTPMYILHAVLYSVIIITCLIKISVFGLRFCQKHKHLTYSPVPLIWIFFLPRETFLKLLYSRMILISTLKIDVVHVAPQCRITQIIINYYTHYYYTDNNKIFFNVFLISCCKQELVIII